MALTTRQKSPWHDKASPNEEKPPFNTKCYIRNIQVTYVPDFLCQIVTFLFRFSAQALAAFAPLSRTEHAPERPDPISEHYLNSLIRFASAC
jgi:hypothetical protein